MSAVHASTDANLKGNEIKRLGAGAREKGGMKAAEREGRRK